MFRRVVNRRYDRPALLLRYLDPNAVRLDHYYLAANPQADRGPALRQIADAIRYAHSKRGIHRALGPQSILVSDTGSCKAKIGR